VESNSLRSLNMTKAIMVAGTAMLAGWLAWGQAAPQLSFEVSSVKPSVPGPWRESKVGPDRLDFPGVTLRYCLAFAYGVKEYQITGPAWVGEIKYDIVAKGPLWTLRDQLPRMMQTLLAQRFKMQVRNEMKSYSVYALMVGKGGPKLKELPPDPAAQTAGARFGMGMTATGTGRLEVKSATMTSLANTLGRMLGRPVVDLTALTGRYDMDLEYSREDSGGMRLADVPGASLPSSSDPGVSIFGSIQQFGLKLEAQKLPLKTIVVDSAEKTPIEN